jgi:ribosomal protein S14
MNKNINNILKEKILRMNLHKKEIFQKILKSISQNNNINNNIKVYAAFIQKKSKKLNTISSRRHRICLITGKYSGILKGFSFSRYTLKRFILDNKLTNVKKHN